MKKIVQALLALHPGTYTPPELAVLLNIKQRRVYVITSVVIGIGYDIAYLSGITLAFCITGRKASPTTSPMAKVAYKVATNFKARGAGALFVKTDIAAFYKSNRNIYDVLNVMEALGLTSKVDGKNKTYRINASIEDLKPKEPAPVASPIVRRRSIRIMQDSKFIASVKKSKKDVRPLEAYYNDMPDELNQLFFNPLI